MSLLSLVKSNTDLEEDVSIDEASSCSSDRTVSVCSSQCLDVSYFGSEVDFHDMSTYVPSDFSSETLSTYSSECHDESYSDSEVEFNDPSTDEANNRSFEMRPSVCTLEFRASTPFLMPLAESSSPQSPSQLPPAMPHEQFHLDDDDSETMLPPPTMDLYQVDHQQGTDVLANSIENDFSQSFRLMKKFENPSMDKEMEKDFVTDEFDTNLKPDNHDSSFDQLDEGSELQQNNKRKSYPTEALGGFAKKLKASTKTSTTTEEATSSASTSGEQPSSMDSGM